MATLVDQRDIGYRSARQTASACARRIEVDTVREPWPGTIWALTEKTTERRPSALLAANTR
jgi:hypothetical protein